MPSHHKQLRDLNCGQKGHQIQAVGQGRQEYADDGKRDEKKQQKVQDQLVNFTLVIAAREAEEEQLCEEDRRALQPAGGHLAPAVREDVWPVVEPHQQAPLQVDGQVPQTVFAAHRQ